MKRSAEFPAALDVVAAAVDWIMDALKVAGFPASRRALFELALVEGFTNIVTHAYQECTGSIGVEIRVTESEFSVVLSDDGPPFDPTTAPLRVRGGDEEGGMGRMIIAEACDQIAYQREHDRNYLSLIVKRD